MPKKLTTADFVARAKAVHGDLYDYSQVKYEHSHKHVTIICPEHGPFEQLPANHIHYKQKCPNCGHQESGKKRTFSTADFVTRAIEVHGNKYDYSEVKYKHSRTKVTIICPEHGPFEQLPANHIHYKRGCKKCGGRKSGDSRRFTESDFKARAREIHGDKYDYSEVKYEHSQVSVTIICPEHGPFNQLPSNHLAGTVCPGCSTSGFDPNMPGILYYLAVTTDHGSCLYKIGITNNSVQERFTNYELDRIRVVRIWQYSIGEHALSREREILKLYELDRYVGPMVLIAGNSEMFTRDVLGLDDNPE